MPKRKTRASRRKAASSSEEDDPIELTEPVAKRARSSRVAKKAAEKADEIANNHWENIDDATSCLVFNPPGVTASDKIVAFDMDDTLIHTKSGRTFATSRQDWKWFSENVVEKLKELHADGFKLVIFTNQGGINGKNGHDKNKERMITGKIEDIIEELGIPMQAFIACSDDKYRKPQPSMWKLMISKFNDDVEVDADQCTYVGDAAGRPKGWKPKKKKDFSCSDRKFAFNSGIEFATPEAFFDGEKEAEFDWQSLDPRTFKSASTLCDGGEKSIVGKGQELILFVGWPGSGKSTFANKYLVPNGYTWINRDTLGTRAKCIKLTREALARGESVVVDNTNPASNKRVDYINLAADAEVPIRCFYFTASRQLAEHLNMYRERLAIRRHAPRIAYAVFNKHFDEPTVDEGFTEVKKVNFVMEFDDEHPKDIFMQFA